MDLEKEGTSVRLIGPCHRIARAGFTALFPETELTSSPNSGPATHGSRRTASGTAFQKKKKKSTMQVWRDRDNGARTDRLPATEGAAPTPPRHTI